MVKRSVQNGGYQVRGIAAADRDVAVHIAEASHSAIGCVAIVIGAVGRTYARTLRRRRPLRARTLRRIRGLLRPGSRLRRLCERGHSHDRNHRKPERLSSYHAVTCLAKGNSDTK